MFLIIATFQLVMHVQQVLVGVARDDGPDDLTYIVNKILSLRLFENDAGKMGASNVVELKLPVLCVSQFTLYANTKKGAKPDFHTAMAGDAAKDFCT